MLGEQNTKTNTLYSLQPHGFLNRTVGATTDISAPSIHMSNPLIGSLDQRILICGDSFTTTASSDLPAAFATNLTMLAHSANKIGLSATVNEFVSAQVVVLGSA
jgi:alginate O-acetyltransferase complex protein AlgJ